jgi:hypothetical protein
MSERKTPRKATERQNQYEAERDKEVQQIRDSQWAKDQEKKNGR